MTARQEAPISGLVQSQLERLGYDAFFERHMAELEGGLLPARVVGQHRREWDVAGEDLSGRAVLAGKRWAREDRSQAEIQPTIGDWVALRVDEQNTLPVIEHVLPRRTELARAAVGKRGERQVVVANVDLLVIVAACAPDDAADAVALRSTNPRRIERYLTAVESGGAEALVVLNKADLRTTAARDAEELEKRLGSVRVITSDCASPGGLDALRGALRPGQTAGFVGLSGVGKSTIVNRLLGREAQRTSQERGSDARGRHTTTHRELFVAPDGWLLIDTPGMREFSIDTEDADLSSFTDIAELSADCRFRNCRHAGEPGCRVEEAVRQGELDADRLESFRTLEREVTDPSLKRRGRTPAPRGPSTFLRARLPKK